MEAEKTPTFLYEKSCKVTEPDGLCSRQSYYVVIETARSFGSFGMGKVFIRRAENQIIADPFNIMSVMLLAVSCGTELVVFTNHPSLVEKVDGLAEFINTVSLHTRVDFSYEDYRKVMTERYELKKHSAPL